MDRWEAFRQLVLDAAWEGEPEEGAPRRGIPVGLLDCVTPVHAGGRRVRLLKVLLSSACERDCLYCPFRAGRSFRRTVLTPEALAGAFLELYDRGLADGIFLSSGLLGGSVQTQDRLLAAAEILRRRGYRGYLHLKLMPGATDDQVEAACRWADRVSVNLEAPTPETLGRLAPRKTFDELWRPLEAVGRLWRRRGRAPSAVTQFVVGPAGETDRQLLGRVVALARRVPLARTYFSPFRPVRDTPLEGTPPTPPLRARRLYQAEFLLRRYGWRLEELPFDEGGNLDLSVDPKTAWARRHLHEPVEVLRADRELLLRVPGIGPKTAERILRARREGGLRSPEALARLGVNLTKAGPYLRVAGRPAVRQLRLWPGV